MGVSARRLNVLVVPSHPTLVPGEGATSCTARPVPCSNRLAVLEVVPNECSCLRLPESASRVVCSITCDR